MRGDELPVSDRPLRMRLFSTASTKYVGPPALDELAIRYIDLLSSAEIDLGATLGMDE